MQRLFEIIANIDITKTLDYINNARENNIKKSEQASDFETGNKFIQEENRLYDEILKKIDTFKTKEEKQEFLFYAYFLTEGLTRTHLQNEKQKIIDYVSIGM